MVNFARLIYYLASAMQRQHWDRDKLRKYQEKRLRAVVKYAYEHVPFYHKKFKSAGIKPDDIKCLENLSKLPLIRKSEFRQVSPRQRVSIEFDINKLKMIRTSGSTGEPFTIYICDREDEWRKAIYMRANISCGQRPRDRWVTVTAPHHFHDTTEIQRMLGIYAQKCISVFERVEDQVKKIEKFNPDILDGYSGSLLLLAQEVKRQGINTIRPRIIFGSADFIGIESRKFLEDVFNAPFYDQFGCAEIDRSAWQCIERNNYHMDVDSVIIQFIDENGEEVAHGERGEIVYTSLFNYAHPIIRYAINDVGIPVDGECSCNIKLPLMKIVEGRKDSFIVLRDGRIFAPMSFWTIMRYFKYSDYIEKFRVIQKSLDMMEILVKKTKTMPFNEDFLRKSIIEHVANCLRIDLEGSFELKVEFVEEIPLDKSGKVRSVISLVSASQNI
jgi:phenylacetate-CoA ligase